MTTLAQNLVPSLRPRQPSSSYSPAAARYQRTPAPWPAVPPARAASSGSPRPQRVRLLDRHTVGFVGRLEDDRGMPVFRSASDEFGRLEPVEAGHLHIQQDDGELA